MAAVSPRSNAPNIGFIRPASITKVKSTAICAIILFSFFTPVEQINSKIPIKVGISAVILGVSDEKYPQDDSYISTIAFMKFAICGLIF